MGDQREREWCLEREREIMPTLILGAEGAVGEAAAWPEANLVVEREQIADARSERKRIAGGRCFCGAGGGWLRGERPVRVTQRCAQRQAIDHEIIASDAR